jgi:MFS family permease
LETNKAFPGAKLYYGYIMVIASTLILVGALGIHYAFGVFFKPLIADFHWSRAVTSGAVSLSFILQGFSSIGLGALNDKLGPRITLSLSGVILGMGYLLMSQVHHLWQLYLFYGVMVGCGLGGIFVPVTSSVAHWFGVRRNSMTGIVVAGIGIGTLIAPIVANWLISLYDWRRSYLILGIAVLIIVITAAQFLKGKPKFGEMPAGEVFAAHTPAKGLLFKEALYTSRFWIAFAIFVCFGICLYVVLVHIVPFATDNKISAVSAAGIISAIGGVSILGKVVFGRIGDKIGNRNLYLVGFSLMTAAFLWLLTARDIWMMYIFAVIFGLAYAACAVCQSPVVAALFGLKSHGVILGALNCAYNIGAAIGPAAAGFLFDVQGDYHWAFLISAVVAVMGLILALVLKPSQFIYRL